MSDLQASIDLTVSPLLYLLIGEIQPSGTKARAWQPPSYTGG